MSENIYSVSYLNSYIDRMFQDDMMLRNITVSGEISNCNYNHTGHIYFKLKDEKASISCVMFANARYKGLKFDMKNGDEVVIKGYVGVYTVGGTYQLYAREITHAGLGDLNQRYEELKARLEELGMFDEMYKKPIPAFATKIGIVTAPTGAAVHDIITVSKKRNPYVSLILYPAQVQGEAAAPSIVEGIRILDEMNLDVIIVGRGGGSIEDLWAFNEEIVARAIFNANTPIISGVGHEPDFTIADFVADRRAATPSNAAEIANFRYDDFIASLDRFSDKYNMFLDGKLSSLSEKLESYKRQLNSLRPENQLKMKEEKLNMLRLQLVHSIDRKLNLSTNRLALISGRLDAMSPAKKLANGFGYISDLDGNRIDSIESVSLGQTIETRISEGTIISRITEINKGGF